MTIDEAWAEAEAALPAGWTGLAVQREIGYFSARAMTLGRRRFSHRWKVTDIVAVGDDPVDALRALTAKLREAADRMQEALR